MVLLVCCLQASAQLHEFRNLQRSLQAITDSNRYVDALNRMAMLAHYRYRDTTLFYALKAKAIAERHNYEKGIADARNNEGIYYLSSNNYLSARYFNEALSIYQELGDKENETQLLMNLSVLLFTNKNQNEALKYIRQAYNLGKDLQHDSIQSIVITDMLAIDQKMDASDRDALFAKGKAIATKYRDTALLISFANNEGTQLYNAGKKKEGLELLLASVKDADQTGSEYMKVAAFMTLGEIMFDMGRDVDGISYYERALKISTDYGYPERYLQLAERLYSYYRAKHMPAMAYEYANLLLAKRAEINDAASKAGYNFLTYALREKQVADLESKDRFWNTVMILLLILFVVVMVVVFFAYRTFQIKRRNMRIQAKLHKASLARTQELEEVDRFNTMLISVIAHDIRQPFSTVLMTAEVFNESIDVLTDAEKVNIMGQLKETAQKSMMFMDGLLTWIKSKNSGFEYQPEELHVAEMLVEANAFFELEQCRKSLKLVTEVPLDLVVLAHRNMLLFVFRNILNNATKYAPEHSAIEVAIAFTDGHVCITFADHGPGMTAEQRAGLFRAMADQDAASDKKGAGLALSVSWEMMQKMQGKISVDAAPGGGTVFCVLLPYLHRL
ncbi:histidine kinase/DNA gyrase B/HSP90-like ATPase [Pedobacter duraquae]|uniref:histidine kinase n=2 Tax=Pedobacter duraquae TaxID=425511 RepID=A0A4R6IBT4_9SPHI|nr:histidine kinase/DNA gyrase B/HSP90-like ATPase [Pedobacter duraquae]